MIKTAVSATVGHSRLMIGSSQNPGFGSRESQGRHVEDRRVRERLIYPPSGHKAGPPLDDALHDNAPVVGDFAPGHYQ